MEKFVIIIKPGFLEFASEIKDFLTKRGIVLLDEKRLRLTKQQAETFYRVHDGKPFFESLTDYMSSDEVIFVAVEGSISDTREMIGNTDPREAQTGTIRHRWGRSVQNNVVHCSDSLDSAGTELDFFNSIPESQ